MGKGPPTLSSGNASSIPARGSYKRAWGGGHGGGVIDIYTWPWSYDHRGGGGRSRLRFFENPPTRLGHYGDR